MATLIDLTGGFEYKSSGSSFTPITPDVAQQQSLPYTQPAPAAPVAPQENVWDSTYQMWRDPSGRLWDSDSGLWLTPGETPEQMQVYREGVGDQSVAQYNDYNKVLQEFYGGQDGGGFAGNPIVAQPSAYTPPPMSVTAADWTNIDSAMDRPSSVTPSAGWYNVDAALDPYRGMAPDASSYKLPTTSPLTNYSTATPDLYGKFGGANGGTLPKSGNGLSSLLGNVNKYINAGAETVRDFSEPGLRGTPAGLGFLATDALGLTERPTQFSGGALQNLVNSRGNPNEFVRQQNADLASRGTADELITQLAFDPTNLIGAGIATKALKGAEGASALSKILRGAGAANQAIDTGTAKILGGLVKPLGAAAKPLMAEAGNVPAGVAARVATGAAGGVAGNFAAPDDASAHERAMYIVGGALAGAVGPEVFAKTTKTAANLYGDVLQKTGIGREQGTFAHQSWFENAPNRELSVRLQGPEFDGVAPTRPINSPVSLKIIKDVPPGLPLTQKIKNAYWEIVSTVYDPKKAANKLDPETYKVFKAMGDELRATSDAVPVLRQMVGSPQADALFKYEPNTNFIYGTDGELLPILDENGAIRMREIPGGGGEIPSTGVRASDLALHKDQFLALGLITPEQYRALEEVSDKLLWIRDLQEATDLLPDGELRPGWLPSGNGKPIVQEATPVKPKGQKVLGGKPGSSKKKPYEWGGDTLEHKGLVFPTLDEAVGQHIDAAIKEVIVKHYSGQLSETIGGVTTSYPKQIKKFEDELKEAKKAATELKARKKVLTARQVRNDRDVRLTNRWIDTNEKRMQALVIQARDQTITATERAEALADAHVLATTAIRDHLTAAEDYAKITNAVVKDAPAREALNKAMFEADQLSKRLVDLEGQLENVDDVVRATSDAWSAADNIADALADDFAETARRMDVLEQNSIKPDFDAARTRKALDDAKGQFADKVQAKIKKAEELARREERAASNMRANISTAKSEELNRVIENRARFLGAAFDRQSETAQELERVKTALQANIDNRHDLKAAIKSTQELGRNATAPLRGTELKNRLPGWEPGLTVPAAWQNTLDNLIPYEPKGSHGAIVAFDMLNNIMRAVGATADASWGGTVGLLGLADDPRIGAKALKEGWLSALNPSREWNTINKIAEREAAKGMPTLERAVLTGHLQIAPAEVMNLSLGKPGSWLNKLEETRPIQFFDALYRAPGDVTRVEQFYKTLGNMKASGVDITTDKAIIEAANAANVISGRATRGPLGMSGAVSGRTFFAGRFFQSQVETVLNAMLVSGVEGDVARRALLRLAGAGAAFTYTVNKLNGQETEWNPIKGFEFKNPIGDGGIESPIGGSLNSNFMRVRMLGHDYSVFGPWDSLVKGIVATAQGEPHIFLRSKMAPISGAVADVVKGSDAIGRPLDRTSIGNYAPVPFGVRDVVKQGFNTDFTDPKEVAGLGLSATAGLLGIKNSPMTPREVYNEALGKGYKDFVPVGIDGKPLNYAMPKDPLNDPLFLAQYAATHPNDVPPASSQLGKQLAKEKADYAPKFEINDTKFTSNQITVGDWKDERGRLKNEQRGALKNILAQMDFADAADGTPAKWVQDYYATFDQAEKEGLTGKDFWNRVDKLQAEWLGKNGPVAQEYIDALSLAKTPDGPEKEYRAAMLKLNQDGYWDMPRYVNKVSDLSDQQVSDLRDRVSELTDEQTGDPKYKALFGKPFKDRALFVLSDLGKTPKEIIDVTNATGKNEDPDFWLYKQRNAQTLAWLNPTSHYDTLSR